jgi:sec-independent protein translocase protein TatB
MFDLTSSKLLILGLVALIVVGPKDLPVLLRTIGRYVGMIRRQANEFRAQFDAAMREAELERFKEDADKLGREVEESVMHADRTMRASMADAEKALGAAASTPSATPTGNAVSPGPAPVPVTDKGA